MTQLTVQHLPPVTQFSAYASAVNQIPMLTEEMEKELTSRVHKKGDQEAAFQLILSHLRLSVKVAKENRGYGLPVEDLVQEGNLGLMKAVKRFNPDRGGRLAALALIWIRAEVRAYIMKNWKIVRIATTQKLKRLFFSFRQQSNVLEQQGYSGKELNELLSSKLNISLREVEEAHLRFSNELSLDQPLYADSTATLSESLEAAPISIDYAPILEQAIESLPDRERDILYSRFFSTPTRSFKEISEEYNISVGRVSQLEKQAIARLKKHLPSLEIS